MITRRSGKETSATKREYSDVSQENVFHYFFLDNYNMRKRAKRLETYMQHGCLFIFETTI